MAHRKVVAIAAAACAAVSIPLTGRVKRQAGGEQDEIEDDVREDHPGSTLLGWAPRVPLNEGLAITCAFFASELSGELRPFDWRPELTGASSSINKEIAAE